MRDSCGLYGIVGLRWTRSAPEAPKSCWILQDHSREKAHVQNNLPDILLGIRQAAKSGFNKELVGITPTTEAGATLRGINYGGKLYANLVGETSFSIDRI